MEDLPPEWSALGTENEAPTAHDEPAAAEPRTEPTPSRSSEPRRAPDPKPSRVAHLRALGPDDDGGRDLVDGALAKQPDPREEWNGVSPPSRRGGSGRVLTDVHVDHGFAPRELADLARMSVLGSVAPASVRTRLLAGIDAWLRHPGEPDVRP